MKQRLVGATVLAAVGVVVLPMVLDDRQDFDGVIQSSNIPDKPKLDFQSRIVPLEVAAQPEGAENSGGNNLKRGLAKERIVVPTESGGVKREREVKVDNVEKSVQRETQKEIADRGVPADTVRVGLSAWAVQVGSFSQAGNALGLRDRLRKKGFTSFVETVYVEKKKITRV
ncbi:MAG: hypothetical protein GY731_12275, partial [Gammaproteobacteria bacterium]|nr:hypothetical protein [Gammaproteobacteria bacterium]